MKVKPTIYFVTTNERKFSSLQHWLKDCDVALKRLIYDFDEGRSLDIESVTKYKMEQAKKAFPGKQLIVDDRGFFIPALSGFPGPFVKLVLNSFSYGGIIKLMSGVKDRRAIFSTAVSYYDGKEEKLFVADEVGFITPKPAGDNLHGWSELLYVYGHPSFPGKSLAELNDKQWQEYLDAISDVDPFSLFADYLGRKA